MRLRCLPADAKQEVAALARQRTRHAIETLFRIMVAPATPANVKVAAAQALLDRAWGKPPQAAVVAIAEPERLAQVQATLAALRGKRVRFIDGSMVVE